MLSGGIILELLIDSSRKHGYIMLTAFKPHFYLVKLGFTGVHSMFSAQKHILLIHVRTALPRRF